MGGISKRCKKGIWVFRNAALLSIMALKPLSPSFKFILVYFALSDKSWLLQITQMWVQILFLPVIVTLGKLSDFLSLSCVTNLPYVSQIADKYKKEMCMKALCTHAWQIVGCPGILSVTGNCYFLNEYVLSFVISTRGYNTSMLISYRCMFELK